MKKVLSFLAIAAMVCCVACKKNPTPTPKPNGGGNEQQGGEQQGGEEQKPTTFTITIDGDFSDWAKIPSDKLATANCASNPKYTGLKVMKVYATEQFINMYFECDPAAIADGWVTIDAVLNADNDAATGGYGEFWTDMDAEWLLEGPIANEGDATSYDCALFKWWGEPGTDGWNWTDPSVDHNSEDGWGAILPEGSGIGSSAGDMASGKFEIQVIREMLAGAKFASDQFTIAAFLSAAWASCGALPNADITDDNPNGKAAKLVVKIDK